MSYYLNKLKNQKFIDDELTHVKNKTRKQKIYFLTFDGRNKALELREQLMNKIIVIQTADEEQTIVKYPEVTNFLKENNICQELNELQVCKLINNKGILETTIIPPKKQDFIYFSQEALKPEFFYGRKNELISLKNCIADKDFYNFIIVYGIAGIGKTSLMSRLIETYKGNKNIFWFKLNKWETVRNLMNCIFEFAEKITENDLKFYIDFNKPIEPNKLIELIQKEFENLNAIFVLDDFHKANEDIRNIFNLIIEKADFKDNIKFIFLSRYIVPFYDRQKVIVKKNVAEFEIEGLDFESSKKILQQKGIRKSEYRKIYNRTSGNPLLLEIIDSRKEFKKYIYEEIFSELTDDEKKVMEITSTTTKPLPYEAFFINGEISPQIIDNLNSKLIIREFSNRFYDSHDFIKEFFYRRLSPQQKEYYHCKLGDWYLKQKNVDDYLEALYHQIKSYHYDKVLHFIKEKAQNLIEAGYSEKLLNFIDQISEEDMNLNDYIEILLLKAKLNLIIGDWDKSIQNYYHGIEISSELGLTNIKAMTYCKIGHILEEQNNLEESLKNFNKSLKISQELKDYLLMAEAKRGIGRYHWRINKYRNAEKYYKECLKDLENTDNLKLIGSVYIDYGNNYLLMGKYDRAIKYIEIGLNYSEKINAQLEIARAYNSIGSTFTSKGEFEKAIIAFEKMLKIINKIGDVKLHGYGLSNIGYCYAKLNKITHAKKYLEIAKKIYEKTNNENILFQILRTEALIEMNKKNWDKALDLLNESLKIVERFNIPLYVSETLLELTSLYEKQGDLNNKNKYFKKYQKIYDGLGEL